MSQAGKEAERLLGFRSAPPRVGLRREAPTPFPFSLSQSYSTDQEEEEALGSAASFAAERGAHGAWSLPEPVRGQLLLQHNMEAAAPPPPPPLLLVLFLLAASVLRCNLGSVAGTFCLSPPLRRLLRSRASGRGDPIVVETENFLCNSGMGTEEACVGGREGEPSGRWEALRPGACVAAGRGKAGGWGGCSHGE